METFTIWFWPIATIFLFTARILGMCLALPRRPIFWMLYPPFFAYMAFSYLHAALNPGKEVYSTVPPNVFWIAVFLEYILLAVCLQVASFKSPPHHTVILFLSLSFIDIGSQRILRWVDVEAFPSVPGSDMLENAVYIGTMVILLFAFTGIIVWFGWAIGRSGLLKRVSKMYIYVISIFVIAVDVLVTMNAPVPTFTRFANRRSGQPLVLAIAVFLSAMVLLGIGLVMGELAKRLRGQETLSRQMAYYDELAYGWQARRKLRHDLQNHLATAESLVFAGDTSAKEYVIALQERIKALPHIEWCADERVNSVLYSRIPQLKTSGVNLLIDAGPADTAPSLAAMVDDLCELALSSRDKDTSLVLCLRARHGIAVAQLEGISIDGVTNLPSGSYTLEVIPHGIRLTTPI